MNYGSLAAHKKHTELPVPDSGWACTSTWRPFDTYAAVQRPGRAPAMEACIQRPTCEEQGKL